MTGKNIFWKISQGGEKNPLLWIAALFAVALQIQVTLFQSESYTGLRINLADLFLPAALLYAALCLARRKTLWPRTGQKALPVLLGLMTGAMTLALAQSYTSGSGNFTWAFVNKYIGFLILLSYFFLGGWLAANVDRKNIIRIITQVFCGFFLLTLAVSLLDMSVQMAAGVSFWLGDFPWDGFMANRNAFALLAVLCILLMECQRSKSQNWRHAALWVLIPLAAVYNASRAGWIAGSIILGSVLIENPAQGAKKILPMVLLGSVLAYGTTFLHQERTIQNNTQLNRLLALGTADEGTMYGGDRKRLIALEDGLELYRSGNLLTGAGLGRYKDFQIENRGKFIDVIDCTPLWLLVETGLMGLLSFSGFFLVCLYATAKKGFSKQTDEKPDADFQKAVFFFLLVFAAFSLFHEILYTRFLWFVLGVALGAKGTKTAAPPQNEFAKDGNLTSSM